MLKTVLIYMHCYCSSVKPPDGYQPKLGFLFARHMWRARRHPLYRGRLVRKKYLLLFRSTTFHKYDI